MIERAPNMVVTTRSLTRGVTIALALGCAEVAAGQVPGAPLQSAAAGAAVFGEKGCVTCHTTGTGESLGPDLYAVNVRRSFANLAADMWNHIPQMTVRMAEMDLRRPLLTPRQAGDLIAYLYTLHYFAPAGDADRGRDLFDTKKCRLCHQVGGAGGVIGPPLDHVGARGVPIEIAAAMWNHAPGMLEASRRLGIERPSLTQSELHDLLAFLAQAAPAGHDQAVHAVAGDDVAGALVFEDKGCSVCHGPTSAGGRVAVDLAARARDGGLDGFVAAMWNKMPAMGAAMRGRDLPFPILEADEMANLVAYLSSIGYFEDQGSWQRGRSVVAAKCLDCHALGDGTAMDLSDVRGLDRPESVVAAMWNHVLVVQETGPDASLSPLSGEEVMDLIAFFERTAR